jgi:hypothetical protein
MSLRILYKPSVLEKSLKAAGINSDYTPQDDPKIFNLKPEYGILIIIFLAIN